MGNFALIGGAGFVAPRHMKAIAQTGNRLVALTDPHDAVGVVDQYFPDAKYFREIERFDRYVEKLRRQDAGDHVHYVSICSPNYLHDAHVRLALRIRADAICEKPLVIKPWNLDPLRDLEAETGHRAYTVLQLRLHPSMIRLREALNARASRSKADITLSYVTRRGAWYHASWKGEEEKSGGLIANIGIHFFDLLIWLFGPALHSTVHLRSAQQGAGCLELEWARVRWFLSVDAGDLPESARVQGGTAYRSLTIDGEELDFSEGFADLHTAVYREVLAGRGFGIEEARASIEVVHRIRQGDVSPAAPDQAHPFLAR